MFDVMLIGFNYSTFLIPTAIHSLFHFDAWLTTMQQVDLHHRRTHLELELLQRYLSLLRTRFTLASPLRPLLPNSL